MKRTLGVFALAMVFGSACAQMVTGPSMRGFQDVFRVSREQRLEAFRVEFLKSSAPGNILWPGEKCSVTFRVHNSQETAISVKGRIDVIPYCTKGIPGDIWTPEVAQNGLAVPVTANVSVPAKSSQEFTVPVSIPDRFGGYGFVLDLGNGLGRKFITSVVRTFKSSPARLQYPHMSLDDIGIEALQRLGIQAIRRELGWVPPSSPQYPEFMRRMADDMKRLKDANITVLFVLGAGYSQQPLGRPRPHLDIDDVMIGGKSDMAWVQSQDSEFKQFAYDISKNFGWPKGPITALSLWNEPWEGLSISGWGADMLRYRDMYMAMAQGIQEARKNDGVSVLAAGADSTSNTFDKFFADGTDDYLPYLDALTIHYQGFASSSNIKKFLNRPQGRVVVWDTESWVANTDDRIAAVIAANRMAGYDRSMGVFGGNVRENGSTWAPAAALGAAQHLIGERKYRDLVFPKGLPWVMRFDGLANNVEDSTLVVVGDLGEAFGADNVIHRGVRGLKELQDRQQIRERLRALPVDAPLTDREAIASDLRKPVPLSGGTMTLKADPLSYALFDFYGNPVPSNNGQIVVPLDNRGFFLRSTGKAGGFSKLVAAVKTAKIRGFEPIEVVAHDFTSHVKPGSTLLVDVNNMLNQDVSGSVKIKLADLGVDYPLSVHLNPFESKTLQVRVVSGTANPQNAYPLSVDVETGVGASHHDELMHANVIEHRKIQVDGSLDDWKDATPQTAIAQGANISLATAAWWPMSKFEQSNANGFATGYLAYDENYLYFAAKVADSTPEDGTLRFEKRDDDSFFYPKVSFEYDPFKTLLSQQGKEQGDNKGLPELPGGGYQRFYRENTVKNMQIGYDLSLPADRMYKVAVYVGRGELHPNGVAASLVNPANGQVLAEKTYNALWDGAYIVFEACGNTRLQLRANGDFYTAKAYCVLLDDVGPSNSGLAHFYDTDYTTKSSWSGTYGKAGYYFVNGPRKLPEGVSVKPVSLVVKKDYQWPAGERQFSYRKWPILPSPYEGASYDCVQIAFNALPPSQKWMTMSPPGAPARLIEYPTTDYEYSLINVSPQYGGGTEVWRLNAPGMSRKHFYPRQPKGPYDGPVRNAELAIRHTGSTRISEVAIPWSEIPEVKKLLDAGKTVKFSYRVTDSSISAKPELGAYRSVNKASGLAFHVDWNTGWTNELEFGFERGSLK